MYIPAAFDTTDQSQLHAAMEQYSFATLVSHTGNATEITHLPLLLDRTCGELGTLIGHFAQANGHWKLGAEARTTAIFHGPHAYISPTWYGEPNLVPTWNYVAVHAHGRLRLIEDRERLRSLLGRMVHVYEAAQPTPWRLEEQNAEFIDKLLAAVVGFELPIEKLEGKWKLNQNHPVERRQRVVGQLQSSPHVENHAVASQMIATMK